MSSLPSGTSRSGVTVAGAKTLAPFNLIRKALTIQNTSDTDMRIREDGGVASATNGFLIVAGDAVEVATNQNISVWCAVAGKTYEATEV